MATRHAKIDYVTLMDALVALSGLRYLAEETLIKDLKLIENILDHNYWHFPFNSVDVQTNQFGKVKVTEELPYETLIFAIRIYFKS